jgi:hypothetical protein
MAQMQTLSIRIPDEDFQWLVSLPESGARTPSEKLRALLQRMRQQEQGLSDPERSAAWMRRLVQPFADDLATLERESQTHSDLLAAVVEHVPAIMALLATGRPAQEEGAGAASEALVAQRCFRFFAALLKGAITTHPASYAPGVYERHLPDIIELAEIISSRKGKEANHG